MKHQGHRIEINGQGRWSTLEDPELEVIVRAANVSVPTVKQRAEMLANIIGGFSLKDLKNDAELRRALRELF